MDLIRTLIVTLQNRPGLRVINTPATNSGSGKYEKLFLILGQLLIFFFNQKLMKQRTEQEWYDDFLRNVVFIMETYLSWIW